MPQHFQVLKCYKCLAFQVHQIKKSNKFECKLCGEKQSIKRHYGLGSGKECRLHVQKLNGIRGEVDELKASLVENSESEDEPNEDDLLHDTAERGTKWLQYMNEEETTEETNEPMYLGEAEVVLEAPKNISRKRKNASYSKNNPLRALDNNVGKSRDTKFSEDTTFKSSKTFDKSMDLHEKIARSKSQKSEANSNVISTKINKQSKWAEYTNYIDDDNMSLTKDNIQNASQRCLSENNALNLIQHTSSTPLSNNNNLKLDEYKDEPNVRNAEKSFKIIPVSKKSKWAHYVDNIENNELIPASEGNDTQHQGLFSLCDDSELDDVLNI